MPFHIPWRPNILFSFFVYLSIWNNDVMLLKNADVE